MTLAIVALIVAQVLAAAPQGPVVRSIEFSGNTVFDSRTLEVTLERTQIGSEWQPGVFEADLETGLRSFLKQHGYIKPELHWRTFEDGTGGVRVRIDVAEGPQYRLSSLRVRGTRLYSSEDLVRRLGLQPGDIIDFSKVRSGLEVIKRMYAERGYINLSYLPAQTFDEASRTMGLDFEIIESIPFRIVQVAFTGAMDQEQENRARAVVPFREGDLFRPSTIALARTALSRLAEFARINERDVDIEITSERLGFIRVVFRLNPRR